jgi:hypothetical protein
VLTEGRILSGGEQVNRESVAIDLLQTLIGVMPGQSVFSDLELVDVGVVSEEERLDLVVAQIEFHPQVGSGEHNIHPTCGGSIYFRAAA